MSPRATRKAWSIVWPPTLSPICSSAISSDAKREVARLRVPPSLPRRYRKVDGQRVDLTPERYHELAQLSGQPAKSYLDGVLKTREYRSSADERAEFIKETLEAFRAAGREAPKQRYPSY